MTKGASQLSNWTDKQIDELWNSASSRVNPNRDSALEDLFNFLKENDRKVEANQIGAEWLSTLDDGFASVELFDCAFQVAINLSEQGRHDESIALINRVADYPDVLGCDFERGLLLWHASEDFRQKAMPCDQLQALQLAAAAFRSADGLRAKVLYSSGKVQRDLGLLSEAKASLSESIILSEEVSEAVDVGWSKSVLAEVLISEGHFSMAREVAREASLIFEFLGNHAAKKQNQLLEAQSLFDSDPSTAEQILESLLLPGDSIHERRTAAKARYQLGLLCLKTGREDQAKESFRIAKPVLRAIGLAEIADQIS
jgi:tetratricopeptide (TPR) repeat protein